MKSNKKIKIIVVSSLLVVALITLTVMVGLEETFESIPEDQRNYCSEKSRQADACIAVYQPVCGWSDSEKVQCLVFPCAQTYSNSCFACMDEKVAFWTQGDCPNSK